MVSNSLPEHRVQQNSKAGNEELRYAVTPRQLCTRGAGNSKYKLSASTPAALIVLDVTMLNDGGISWSSLAKLGLRYVPFGVGPTTLPDLDFFFK